MARKIKKVRGDMTADQLVKIMEEMTGKTLEQLVDEAGKDKRPRRFIGGSTFYGSQEDFDKYSELGIRF
jgi:hypothetical protein